MPDAKSRAAIADSHEKEAVEIGICSLVVEATESTAMPDISVGSSGARLAAAAAAAAAASELSWIWKPPTSVIGVAMNSLGATISA